MDPRLQVDKLIDEAIADGRLDPTVHAGKPLPKMRRNDTGWWIRAFLDRDSLPERYDEARAAATALLESAVRADTLEEARAILAERAAGVDAWNRAAPETHRITPVDEVEMLDRRQQLRGTVQP